MRVPTTVTSNPHVASSIYQKSGEKNDFKSHQFGGWGNREEMLLVSKKAERKNYSSRSKE